MNRDYDAWEWNLGPEQRGVRGYMWIARHTRTRNQVESLDLDAAGLPPSGWDYFPGVLRALEPEQDYTIPVLDGESHCLRQLTYCKADDTDTLRHRGERREAFEIEVEAEPWGGGRGRSYTLMVDVETGELLEKRVGGYVWRPITESELLAQQEALGNPRIGER